MRIGGRWGTLGIALISGWLAGACSGPGDDVTIDVPDVHEATDGDTEVAAEDGGGDEAAPDGPGCDAGLSPCGIYCVDLQHDPDNCGACGNPCGATESCDDGSCVPTCGGGRTSCDRSCVDTQSDPLHCSDCATACPTATEADPTCTAGVCGLACHAGFVDVDGEPGCEYECTAAGVETCNAVDDDCDGQTDEDFPCMAGAAVECPTACGSAGTGTCGADCSMPTGAACALPAETCNGVDDDCNGRCDDGFGCCRGATTPCLSTCGSIGARTCGDDCAWSDCAPTAEACNGLDDDCDTLTDEDFDCVRRATEGCLTDCGSDGSRTCDDTCTWSVCTPPHETCNGLDDDCDTVADNGFECPRGAIDPCDAGCVHGGARTCGAVCTWGACLPPAETCNGVDDDCDTVCDDGFACCAGTPMACTNSCGVAGTESCDLACNVGATCCAATENCSSACDDDCDTLVNEDCCPGAVSIPVDATSVSGNTCGLANNRTASCGASAASPDIPYIYTPSRSGTATFAMCGGASFDTVLHAHSDCLAGSELACNDDYCGLQSTISFTVTAGSTYYVFMDGYSSGNCGPFTMFITNP